jgi:hypothetical protein
MMRRIGTMVLAAGLAALLATPAFAQRQPGGRGFGPPQGLMLLNNKSVKDELKIGDDQGKKIQDAASELRTKYRDDFRDAGMDREKMQAVFKKMRADGEKIIADTLKPEQVKRFKQLEIQVAGLTAFTQEDVQKALKLTDDQKKKIDDTTKDLDKERRDLYEAAGMDRDKRTEARKKVEAMSTKALEEVSKSLSSDQQKAWKDLVGEKFDYKPETGRPMRNNNRF